MGINIGDRVRFSKSFNDYLVKIAAANGDPNYIPAAITDTGTVVNVNGPLVRVKWDPNPPHHNGPETTPVDTDLELVDDHLRRLRRETHETRARIRKLGAFSCTTEQLDAAMDREAARRGPIDRALFTRPNRRK